MRYFTVVATFISDLRLFMYVYMYVVCKYVQKRVLYTWFYAEMRK